MLVWSRISVVLLLLLTGSLRAELVLEYEAPQNLAEKAIQRQLQGDKNLQAVFEFIRRDYVIDPDITLVFGGEDGPAFDAESSVIFLPYFFIEEIKARFSKDNYVKTGVSVDEAVSGALAHTVLHELVHALIALYEIPVLGKEEDAADNVATLLLIENIDKGAEIAISAADLFALEDEAGIELLDEDSFWDEHSLDAQRYYATLCQVFGSDPETYADIEEVISTDRAGLCVEEYELLINSWKTLSKSFSRTVAQPNEKLSQ